MTKISSHLIEARITQSSINAWVDKPAVIYSFREAMQYLEKWLLPAVAYWEEFRSRFTPDYWIAIKYDRQNPDAIELARRRRALDKAWKKRPTFWRETGEFS